MAFLLPAALGSAVCEAASPEADRLPAACPAHADFSPLTASLGLFKFVGIQMNSRLTRFRRHATSVEERWGFRHRARHGEQA